MGVLKRVCKVGGHCEWGTMEKLVRVGKKSDVAHVKVVQCRKCGERP